MLDVAQPFGDGLAVGHAGDLLNSQLAALGVGEDLGRAASAVRRVKRPAGEARAS